MTDLTLSRRAVTRAIATLPAISIAPSAISGIDPDAAIKAAWERRKAAYAEYNRLSGADDGTGESGRKKNEQYDIIDRAEEEICSSVARTPDGVAIQLWVSLYHILFEREFDEMITRGDLEGLARCDKELDWNGRFIVAALQSLRAMGAVS